MAENGKDDHSDAEDDEGHAQGNEATPNQHKGMSLKGKEEWKDVSVPKMALPHSSQQQQRMNERDDASRQRSPLPNGDSSREHRHSKYPGSPTQHHHMARTVSGQWLPGRESSDLAMRHQDQARPGSMERVRQRERVAQYATKAELFFSFFFPFQTRSMSQYSSYPGRHGQVPMNSLHSGGHHDYDALNRLAERPSLRPEPSRYQSLEGSNYGGSSSFQGRMDNLATPHSHSDMQTFSHYCLPVDHGINSDGSIDWTRAAAAAQLQAALQSQQAQLAYLRQQRQQQEHWRELLSAGINGPAGSSSSAFSSDDPSIDSAMKRFNELVSSGQDPSHANGFQWPIGGGGSSRPPGHLGFSPTHTVPSSGGGGGEASGFHSSASFLPSTDSTGSTGREESLLGFPPSNNTNNSDWYTSGESALRSSAMIPPVPSLHRLDSTQSSLPPSRAHSPVFVDQHPRYPGGVGMGGGEKGDMLAGTKRDWSEMEPSATAANHSDLLRAKREKTDVC